MTFWRRALAAASSFFETASARLFEIVLISERKLFARRRRFSDWRTRLRACFEWAMELLGVFLESGVTGKGRDHIPRPGERQALSTPREEGDQALAPAAAIFSRRRSTRAETSR